MALKFIRKGDFLILEENDKELLSIPKYEDPEENKIQFHIEDIEWELSKKICACNVKDIPYGLCFYSGGFISEELPNVKWHEITRGTESVIVELGVIFNWESWALLVTIQEFLESYKVAMNEQGFDAHIIKEDDWASLTYTFKIKDGTLEKGISESIKKAKEVYQTLVTKVMKDASTGIFVRVFEFPEGYENICSQYLIWFGEFLHNLGINANVSTENNNNQTTIIVSPNQANELTDKIEKLFYQYLSLPYAEYIPATKNILSVEDKYKYQMLSNQLDSFKSQIQMKDSIIEMKEVTISSLKESVENKDRELLLISSMKNQEGIQLLGGMLSIGEIKWGAFKFSPKKALEQLRKDV